MTKPTDLAIGDTLRPDDASDGTVRLTELPEGERYKQEGFIGRGGMGVVTSRYDRRIGRHVATKELRHDLASDPQVRARFLREAQVQGQLEHPSVVPVYDLGTEQDGSPYFTMKTIRGVTLAEIVHRLAGGDTQERFARHRLLAAFARVCLAVDYAHRRGIIHRDLKPANLILGEYGEVYVLDWGLAKIVDGPEVELDARIQSPATPAVTHVGAFLGTPGYMPPEQIADPRTVGPAADVYSLGAVLFELLTLEPLHPRGPNAMESTRRGIDARPSMRAPHQNVAPELEAAIVRATSLRVHDRFPSARAFADAIERYLEGERDLELRREKSAAHARAALRAADDVRAGGPAALNARRRAMQEIGRALALDPTNVGAISTMIELLSRPPEHLPPELAVEIERGFRRDVRWISSVGAGIYTAMFGFVALVLWMGVRQPAVVGGFFALMAVSAALSIVVARSREPRASLIIVSMIASGMAFAIATRFVSPFLLVPSSLAINATGYAVFLRRHQRPAVTLFSCASLLVPLALELTGVLQRTLTFAGGQMVITPAALSLPPLPTTLLLTLASIASIVLGSVVVGYIRDRLAVAEQRTYLYAWHLREFIPHEARGSTDLNKSLS